MMDDEVHMAWQYLGDFENWVQSAGALAFAQAQPFVTWLEKEKAVKSRCSHVWSLRRRTSKNTLTLHIAKYMCI